MGPWFSFWPKDRGLRAGGEMPDGYRVDAAGSSPRGGALNWRLATPALFHRAQGEPAHQVALHQEREDDDGRRA
jgi:hypothetical protein